MLLSNSGHRLKYLNIVCEANEDWADLNGLAGRFRIEFRPGQLAGGQAQVTGSHPLVDGVVSIAGAVDNGVPFDHDGGVVLARAGADPALLIRTVGMGEVLVMADVGMLGNNGDTPENLRFWRNLATYARSR